MILLHVPDMAGLNTVKALSTCIGYAQSKLRIHTSDWKIILYNTEIYTSAFMQVIKNIEIQFK